jgi:hypothetical protein
LAIVSVISRIVSLPRLVASLEVVDVRRQAWGLTRAPDA